MHTEFYLEHLNGRWEDTIKIDAREMISGSHLGQDSVYWWAVVNKFMNVWVPDSAGKLLTR